MGTTESAEQIQKQLSAMEQTVERAIDEGEDAVVVDTPAGVGTMHRLKSTASSYDEDFEVVRAAYVNDLEKLEDRFVILDDAPRVETLDEEQVEDFEDFYDELTDTAAFVVRIRRGGSIDASPDPL